MATTSIFDSSEEKCNGFKLRRLIVDGGTEALRKTLKRYLPGNLQTVLKNKHPSLLGLKRKGILDKNQWEKLYPSSNPPNIDEWDITLLLVLLRNICGLSPPNSAIWKLTNMPNVTDHSVEADIVRIRLFRNKKYAHIPNTSVSSADFKVLWPEISLPLVRLGIDKKEIDKLEKELYLSESVLNKNLVSFDFQGEIERCNKKFTEGTRGWVFDQVETWFNDENSTNRAFIVSGDAGMGKTIIAAVVCEKLAEHVGASHFFKHNNSLYSNSKFFLQSLAAQLCKIIPEYREILVEKLSGNLGQSLNDMNIESLFATLFKEPFSRIANPGKRVLIILDAVDEAELDGRDELGSLISKHFPQLPSYLRFLATTRQEKSLMEKFNKYNPLCIEHDDKRNLNDLKLVLQHKIGNAHASSLNTLAEKCDGLMLYAFLLSEMYKEESSKMSIDDLPKGIEEYYKIIFERLGRELGHLKIGDKFHSFLNVIAVAKEPLPEVFLETIFGFENLPDKRQKIRKTVNSISSVFVIREDKSISFMHKSVRDWLVDNTEHDYSVNVQYGHETLFKLCVGKLDELKKRGVTDEVLSGVAAMQYALKYFIQHMLNAQEISGELECLVSDYVTDLEVLFASVCLNVDLTFNNLTYLSNNDVFENFSQKTRTTVSQLSFLLRKFAFFMQEYPNTFLQTIINEGEDDLSKKALTLLETRYEHIGYLEFLNKDRKNKALEAQWLYSGKLSGIDISPKNDFVVCSYEFGGIELFSLPTGKSVWKISDFQVKISYFPNTNYGQKIFPHCIVFHPCKDLILPGTLSRVLTLQGEFTSGPFFCDESRSEFTNCCFSSDNSKMVTYHGDKLIVWSISTGKMERTLECNSLFSFSFTASGSFLGTTDVDNAFKVYDCRNDYRVESLECSSEFSVEIVSTFDENSWVCSVDRQLVIVSNALVCQVLDCSIKDIFLPNNYFCSNDLKTFFQNRGQSWFSKFRKTFDRRPIASPGYISIDDKSVLIYHLHSRTMQVFDRKKLVDMEEPPERTDFLDFSLSLNGNFAYFINIIEEKLSVFDFKSNLKYVRPYLRVPRSFFPIVKDGVIFLGDNDTPELWNIDVTQCLSRFDQFAQTETCMSVSDELIACQCQSYITFFNVFTQEIMSKTKFNRDCWHLMACSNQYHVLAVDFYAHISFTSPSSLLFNKNSTFTHALWKDGVRLEEWESLLNEQELNFFAAFSQQADRLAVWSMNSKKIVAFDVSSVSALSEIPLPGSPPEGVTFRFLDNKNLLCATSEHMLYLTNIERGEVLTCLDTGGEYCNPIPFCRERSIVMFNRLHSELFHLIKVWLPRKS